MRQRTTLLVLRAAALLAVLCSAGVLAPAQTSTALEPDYSKVSDFLDGRRTLLAINDLIIGGLVLPTSDGTKIDDKKIYTLPGYDPKLKNPAEIFARMFDSPMDTLVYAQGSTIYAVDPVSKKTVALALPVSPDVFKEARIAAGDLRGDGFNEIVFAVKGGAFVIGAVNPFDFSKGLVSGPLWTPRAGGPSDPVALAVGDFRGDGHREVVVVSRAPAFISMYLLSVDPRFLRLDTLHENPLVTFQTVGGGDVAVGRFGSTSHDQLLLGYYTPVGSGVRFFSFDFASDLKPVIRHDLITTQPGISEIVLKSGRFDPNSPYEQVAMKYNLGRDNVRLGIVTFNNTLKFRLPNFTVVPVACSTPGLAVGNFSRTEPIPQDPSKSQLSFKLQLAIETDNCGGKDIGLQIFNVNPPLSPPGISSSSEIKHSLKPPMIQPG